MTARDLLSIAAPVMPVAEFQSSDHARACAELFAEAAVPVIEVTLRHPDAWQFVGLCRQLMPHARVGVGTVLNKEQLQRAITESDFAISPGFDPTLCRHVPDGFVYLPGVATASEVMQAMNIGFDVLKFYPAQAAGGSTLLRAFAGPFAGARFCPTGGISASNYEEYLSLPNVDCVGGSWVVPSLEQIKHNRDKLLNELRQLYA